MKWLDQTHGTKFELVRHFLLRMLDGEWSSTPGQWQSVVVGTFALLFPAGMLLIREGSLRPGDAGKYRELARLASPEPFRTAALLDELALLTLVFAVTGLLALIQWQSFFPGRRDYLSLAGLPIRPRQVFAARFGTVLIFSTALVVVMNILPSLIAPHEFGGRWQKNPSFLVNVGAQAAASGLGCFFVLFAIVAIQGVLLNVLSGRLFAKVSVYVQGALIGVLLLAGLYSGSIQEWRPDTIAKLPQFAAWAPPVWFAGLHERLLGDPDPFLHAMASRALLAVLAAVVLMAVTYAGSYRRYRRLLIEDPVQVEAPGKRQWNVLRLLTGEPRRYAVMQFMATTLARSRVHRVLWLAYIGAALAIVLNSSLISGELLRRGDGWGKALRFAVLFWPLGASVVLLTGFRHVLSIPAELPANWIFRLTESQGRKEWMSAVERFVILYAIAPIYLLLFPVAAHILGWPLALRMTSLQLLVSLILFEMLFYSWQQLPFTCSYVPGKRPLIAIVGGYLAALGVGVPLLSLVIRAGSEFAGLFPFFCAFFGGLWVWARHNRRDGWGEARLLYEDLPESIPDLGIKEMSYGGAGHSPAQIAQASHVAMPQPTHRPVAISLRLYRTLAAAFPHEFKTAYEEELLQVTEDAIEPIWRRYGMPGIARLLLDIAIRVPAEHLAELWQDIRYGIRMLAASPGFTAVALISLSLGIGMGTSPFSFINGTILRDLPGVPKPDELVALQSPTSYPNYKRYRERTDLFSSTFVYVPAPFGVWLDGGAERTWGHLVTPAYFSTLGASPELGRLFDEEQEQPGRPPVVVVSYRFWQDHLASDPSVIGKTLRINGYPCAVIGVGPKEFLGASPMIFTADLWMPLSVGARVAPELADDALERRNLTMFHMVGRLQPGSSVARAEAALDTVARQLEQDYGDEDRDRKGRRLTLVTGGKLVPIRSDKLLMLTASPMVLVGLILLIACSNVANMMLARAAGRRKEIAVRLALGASRARLIRQLLTESMLLATAAGALGFLFTIWFMHLLSANTDLLRFAIRAPYSTAMGSSLAPDGRVLLFTLGLALFTGLAFGLAPAIKATRADLTPALKESGAVHSRKYGRWSLRNMLVVSQVAGSLALLLLTGVLALGYHRTMGTEVGFNSTNLYLLSLDPVHDGYSGEKSTAFFGKLLDGVKRLPAVSATSLTDTAPMSPATSVTFTAADAVGNADKYVVGKDYFETLGIPILLGRGFRKEDETNQSTAVIVSERVVHDFWNGGNPLGRRIEIGHRVFEAVGVAKDTKVYFTTEPVRPAIYFPLRPESYARPSFAGTTLMARVAPGVDAVRMLRQEISAIDANIMPFNALGMPEQITRQMFVFRFGVWIHGFEGLFGLILASIGLAGMTAYSVAQRGREIGIRIALGAQRADVLGLVMQEGAVLVAVGSVLGLAGAWAGARLLSGLISAVATTTGASAFDPALLIGAPLLLAGLALVSCYVPARKSMRIDPVVALRQE